MKWPINRLNQQKIFSWLSDKSNWSAVMFTEIQIFHFVLETIVTVKGLAFCLSKTFWWPYETLSYRWNTDSPIIMCRIYQLFFLTKIFYFWRKRQGHIGEESFWRSLIRHFLRFHFPNPIERCKCSSKRFFWPKSATVFALRNIELST